MGICGAAVNNAALIRPGADTRTALTKSNFLDLSRRRREVTLAI